ncbi:DUF2637 domain-containing protein [Actinospica acidiphila]|uniref:DUF2637 domain-containing protein n=1 Tax=Actinospica acidiphila TaxID=304899 RepID=A0A9X5CQR4_9ACTN|nr:DUF2637 domain-containing protein [Actinospica acidiphila]NEC52900.1 DUF2637 domain-containing protein [Actinospica acidiphila]
MRAHLARVDAVIVQAVIAGALSFSHLHDVAAAAGQDGWKAWAYPVSVDLLLVAAWRRMRQSQRAGQAAGGPRLWFLVALAASLGANVATAGLLDLDDVPAWLRVMVAGWPAVAFFGGTLLAHAPHTAEEPASPATDAATAPDGSSSDVEGPDHKVPYPADPEPAPEPAAAPATASAPAPAPAVALPPALVDRVRALAEEHRSATGRPADPDAVRTRLGLPPSMTASVAAHL